jgi:FAD/FMN-containing dehydrogenase
MPLVSSLQNLLGPADVVLDADAKLPHEREWRGLYKGNALAVLKPRSTRDVAEIMRLAAAHNTPVVVHSGNTGLTGGGVPFGALVISTEKMNAVRALDVANASITVEAGVILADLQKAAEAANLLFPLSLGSEGTARVGGLVSTNAGGTAVLRYGNMRDLVLGLEVVLADGRVLHGLKSLRKDNAGYDLKHLFIGSEGTLGIITAATLKLFPRPASTAVAFVGAGDPHALLALFGLMREKAGTDLSGFEILPRFALEITLRHTPGTARPLQGDHPWYALVELSSVSAHADLAGSLENLLAAAMEQGLVHDATIAASLAQANGLWKLREALSDAQTPEGGSIKHDVAVPVSRVADFIVEATAACENALLGLRVCAFGHMGDGNIHFNLSQPVGMEKAAFQARWQEFNRIVHDIVVRMAGSIAAEHGIGLIKRDELARYKDDVTLEVMRSLKAALDPANRLNPGKVIAMGANTIPALPDW